MASAAGHQLPNSLPSQLRVYFQFSLGQSVLAIEASKVNGVVPWSFPNPIPLSPKHILGLINYQGLQALAVMDLGMFLGIGATDDGLQGKLSLGSKRILVVHSEALEVGLLCDQALGVIEVNAQNLTPAAVLSGERLRPYLVGEIQSEQGLVGVLDVDSILSEAKAQ